MANAIRLEVGKLPEAKQDFVHLPRRWMVERSFAWVTRFRRLARDYERLSETLAGLHYLAIVILMLQRLVALADINSLHTLGLWSNSADYCTFLGSIHSVFTPCFQIYFVLD